MVGRRSAMTWRYAVCGLVLLLACQPAADTTVQEASIMEENGDFSGAAKLLTSAMDHAGDDAARRTFAFELDRLRRIRLDYPYDKEQMWEIVERSVRDVTRDEFDRWIEEGKFDIRAIDGHEKFVNTSRSNLFWRYPDIAARRIDPPDDRAFEEAVLGDIRAIRNATAAEGKPYVLPKTFTVTMTVTAKPEAAPPGRTIRAWLPVPRAFPFQTDFSLVASSSDVTLDDENSPIRSAYMEQIANEEGGTEFRIEYRYTHFGIRFDMDPEQSVPYARGNQDIDRFLEQGPHVTFTDQMRALSAEVLAGEENPVRKAKALYNWIAENIQYSYALEYSTIRDLGAYCLDKKYGDCGQEALLYITLCRMNGIPARWQSGWFTFPGGKTIHDWTELYLEPWGWVPVDPYMGIFAMQYLRSLAQTEKLEVRDFYFGGLDQYRIAANSDHAQTLRPPKRSMRSDNVDFQRGELEYDETNIYFNRYRYRLTIEEGEGN